MNAQIFIFGYLRVCMQVLFSAFRWLPVKPAGVLAAFLFASTVCGVSAYADEYDIIIEKNLFHDQRQKWEMEKSQVKGASSQAGPGDRQTLDQINLFGTVIKDSHSYAVMRVTEKAASSRASRRGRGGKKDAKGSKKAKASKRPYAVGDFIGGFQVAKIQSESVLLQDPYDNKQYEIYMNDSQAERTAVRTEIAEDKPEKPPKASSENRKSKRKAKPRPASNAETALRRFESDLEPLRDEKDDVVSRRAERDWEKLQPMMPSLDEEGQEELMRLKSEFEKLRQ